MHSQQCTDKQKSLFLARKLLSFVNALPLCQRAAFAAQQQVLCGPLPTTPLLFSSPLSQFINLLLTKNTALVFFVG
jgi:hypothetical protein